MPTDTASLNFFVGVEQEYFNNLFWIIDSDSKL